jgi:LuxR family maltose regulon positive regulatory protein
MEGTPSANNGSSGTSLENQLLATKLYVPPLRPDTVPRQRLTGVLDEGVKGKLTLVSAPAGSGKSTLLSEWSLRSELPVAWVSLDEGDNDAARFLAYLVAALQKVRTGVGENALAALRSLQPPSVELLLTALVNDMAAILEDFALVLDDYHVIENRSIHDAITFLLEHLPPQMHLIVASRTDPPLPLARWLARGQLIRLTADDLRFADDEAAYLLEETMGLDLSADDVAALGKRTEGWAAGLQLAALSLRGREDIRGFVDAFSGQHPLSARLPRPRGARAAAGGRQSILAEDLRP